MRLPLQITFRHRDPSPALEARIRELVARLERVSSHIMRCHVIVEPLDGHQNQGALYDFHIDITLPDAELAIRRAGPIDQAHEDAYVALRDAFRAARRRLENYERKRRREVKTHNGAAYGRICELDPEHDCGRIETYDGRFIYFHRNSLVSGRYAELATGMRVRFAEERGDGGPQASTVHLL